ncbi:hypothetical protein SEA_SOYO_60 [Mycobacterium phage SoYo]|uniref:Uncharacterized protein n=42 Tax=Microwolfvirus TaxID=2942894 RepID=A0A0A7RW64_9CAUD|nr:hypothetical protein AVV34_gp40 [Mycobacterium phage MarQuardt]YP_009635650.1 hypothetical protein FGG58_gp35 [Mycobacterium phage JHC117]YP_009635735.1 hypothetical protein FGG61_gp35 [Mycobacterium phage Microwolf]YP_010060018.1 hypothetical protein KIJ57_gp33 [Mycobacterium phage Purple Haze]YP_010060101.1 hypothetical protein KIJ58_gp40 [Mycobacterium phage SoilDragon]YP_010060190.1 hypothetical protein KIJ59_gp31 [Mycobacterium phage Zetzy]AEK07721.1 hypothetical protein VIX_60 [Mycob
MNEDNVLRVGLNFPNGDLVEVAVTGWTDPLNALSALRHLGTEEALSKIYEAGTE